ncbi:MAG: hypothetical protein K8J08_02800, partial [Thermoanaerobaculia bacterium]|nr:hypothetical protein [Thermoanaerobaculia bacterium]
MTLGPAGAGGTIWLKASTLNGVGTVDASGGDGGRYSSSAKHGAGGGGRIAIDANLDGFDVHGQALALGGGLYSGGYFEFAAPGTIYIRDPDSGETRLVVDGGNQRGPGKPVAFTTLPSVYKGAIGAVLVEGDDLWIETEDSERFSLGLAGMWVRVLGVDYPILAERADRQAVLLQGAAGSQIQSGDRYVGVYKFDEVDIRGGATLRLRDIVEIGALMVEPDSSLVELDIASPQVSVVGPAEGSLFASGEEIEIDVLASDNTGVTEVTMTLGDRQIVITNPPYLWTLNAPVVEIEQDLDIEVVARDAEDNETTVLHPIRIRPLEPGAAPEVSVVCPSPSGVVLAPGTGLDLFVDAQHDEGVERVEVFLGGASEPIASDFEPPFVPHLMLPVDAVVGAIVPVVVRATSFTGTTSEESFSVRVSDAMVITASMTLGASDTSLEGQSLVVTSGSLEVEGPHQFQDLIVLDGATLTHPSTTTSVENSLEVNLVGDLYVSCQGSIDTTGRGYLPRYGFPNSMSQGSSTDAGGSHGGRGGSFDGSNRVYGNLFDPSDSGGGGGNYGTAGGGVVRLHAAGIATVDGQVLADGGSYNSGPYGAGGSVRLDAAEIAGFGRISASGGGATTASRAAGGGGRVALYAGAISTDLSTRVVARGGEANTLERSGAAGTIYTKLDSEGLGSLIVDNGTVESSQWTVLPAVGRGTVDSVTADGIVDHLAAFVHDLRGHEVGFNGDLTALWLVTGHEHLGDELVLDATVPLVAIEGDDYQGVLRFDHVWVSGTSRLISADSLVTPDLATGEGALVSLDHQPVVTIDTPQEGQMVMAGDEVQVAVSAFSDLGIGQVDFSAGVTTGTALLAPYEWSFTAPSVASPTSLEILVEAEDLTGRRFERTVTVEVQPREGGDVPQIQWGACPSEGDLVEPGSVHSFEFTVTDDEAISGYEVWIDGAFVDSVTGLNQSEVTGSVEWVVPPSAPGTAHSIEVRANDFGGGLGSGQLTTVVPSEPILSGNQTIDATYSGQDLLLGEGVFTLDAPLELSSLRLLAGATVVGTPGSTLDLQVWNSLRIQCGSSLDASAQGYTGASSASTEGGSPDWVLGSTRDYGGSHGGLGTYRNYSSGQQGEIYGSVYLPQHS